MEHRLTVVEAAVAKLADVAEGILMLQRNQEAELAELRRDTQQTKRLWVRLAKRHGWLDEEDLGE